MTSGAPTGDSISTNLIFKTGSEGIVNTNAGSTLTISGLITGTGGLTISGGGSLVLPNANTAGALTGITITNPGSGYTNGTVSAVITGGGGSGATATVTIAGGSVTSFSITAGGVGYTSAPTITFSSGPGSNAILTGVISSTSVGYTGGTVFNGGSAANSGTLSLGGNNSIPGSSGTLVLNNGTVTSGAALLIPNAVTLTSGVGYVTFAGAGSFTFSGAVTWRRAPPSPR